MQYAKWAAKAITAVLTVVAAAIAAGQLDVEPWIEVAVTAAIAGIAVFLVPNGAAPDA